MTPFQNNLPYPAASGTVLCDENNHATVFDGVQLCSARRAIFAHNDLSDLERRLTSASANGPRVVVVEGVYSLEAELAPLVEIAALCGRHGAILYVDDAHGIGIMGEQGGGALQELGLEGRAELVMGSFDKAFGGLGGFLAGRRELISYLRMAARAYMFSSALPATMAGAMLRALEVARRGAPLRERLRRNHATLQDGLRALGFRVLGDGRVPVAPVLLGDEALAVRFQRQLFHAGVFAPAFRWPAVPKGAARIRVTPMASHEERHLARTLEAFRRVGRELGVIGS